MEDTEKSPHRREASDEMTRDSLLLQSLKKSARSYRFSQIPEAPAPEATEQHEEDKRKVSAAALCRRLRSTAFVTGLWHHFVRLSTGLCWRIGLWVVLFLLERFLWETKIGQRSHELDARDYVMFFLGSALCEGVGFVVNRIVFAIVDLLLGGIWVVVYYVKEFDGPLRFIIWVALSEIFLKNMAFPKRVLYWQELHEIGLVIGLGYAIRSILIRKYWGHLMLKKYRTMVNDISLVRNFLELINTDDPQNRPTEPRISIEEEEASHGNTASDVGEAFTTKTEKQLKEDASLKDFWAALRKLGDGNLSVKNVGVLPPEVLFSQFVTVQFAKRTYMRLATIAGLPPVVNQVPTSVINSIVVDKEVAEELAKVYDPAGCGFIYKKRFVNRAVHMYKSYHYLLTSVREFSGVNPALKRIVSCIFWMIILIIYLLMIDYDIQSLILPISTLMVAISFIIGNVTANFFTSLVFVLSYMPYDIGDRVIVDKAHVSEGGQIWVVESVTMLVTKFRTIHNEVMEYPNYLLYQKRIVNFRDTDHACLQITVRLPLQTTRSTLREFTDMIATYAQEHPNTVISATVSTQEANVQENYLQCAIWATVQQSWQDVGAVYAVKGDIVLLVNEWMMQKGIKYEFVTQPVSVTNPAVA